MGNFPLYHFQKGRKDIAEPKMEENTHAFANDLVEPLPYVRSDKPFVPNGSQSGWNTLPQTVIQRERKDIAEPKMEENTHAFANDNVEPLPYVRSADAFVPNGSQSGWRSLSDKSDIANKEVRPDVYHHVSRMINPVAVWRTPNPPPSTYQPSPPADPAYGVAPAKAAAAALFEFDDQQYSHLI